MSYCALDIVYARIKLGKCHDVRPCLLIYKSGSDGWEVLPMTTQRELCGNSPHFSIEMDHANFSATGLKKNSYVMLSELQEISSSDIEKRIGRMDGELARDFKECFGL